MVHRPEKLSLIYVDNLNSVAWKSIENRARGWKTDLEYIKHRFSVINSSAILRSCGLTKCSNQPRIVSKCFRKFFVGNWTHRLSPSSSTSLCCENTNLKCPGSSQCSSQGCKPTPPSSNFCARAYSASLGSANSGDMAGSQGERSINRKNPAFPPL